MYTTSLASSVLVVSCNKSRRLVLEQNIFVSPSNNTNLIRFDTLHANYAIGVNKKQICTQDVGPNTCASYSTYDESHQRRKICKCAHKCMTYVL